MTLGLMHNYVRLSISLTICCALLVACRSQATAPSGKVQVVASFYPLAYLAERVGGEGVNVRTLVEPGVEPHDWEPAPGDVKAIRGSQVFVYHGAGMDPWAARVVRDLPEGRPVVVEGTRGIGRDEGAPGSGEAHDGEGQDPHLWLDPLLYAREAEAIAAGLTAADPAGRDVYAANLVKLTGDLEALGKEMAAGLKDCRRRTIVTSHAAFGYLADRFDLKQVGIAGIDASTEPSPARMRELVELVRREGVTHVFFEALVSPALSDTLARETGAQTLVLDPIEGPTGGGDYLTLMRQNLGNLRTALGCT
jgi:zinc transport system substrate-binding protein